MKKDICPWCGYQQLPECKAGTAMDKPCSFFACDHQLQVEAESVPLRAKKGFLTWVVFHGEAIDWRGKKYFVFYSGISKNKWLIVKEYKSTKLQLRKKADFESVEELQDT